jgi:CheY-like chemotaxis protein
MFDRLAIIVEDNANHAEVLASHLRRLQFETCIVMTILEAVHLCRTLLSPSQPLRQTFVFIDQQLLLHGHSEVEGSTLALLLAEEMKTGLIRPAYLVAISADMTNKRCALAEEAGCIAQIEKPILQKHLTSLQPYFDVPPIITKEPSTAIYGLATSTLELLKTIVAQQPTERLWSGEEVWLVIGLLSEAFRLNPEQQGQAKHLVEWLGGTSRAVVYLRKNLNVLTDERQEILHRLLRKEQQKTIQTDMEIGRTRFENEIRAICDLVAGSWSEPTA